jgi:methylglutaconyl-CoA hydratase
MSHIRVHNLENTLSIVLDRPDKRNALSRAMLADLQQAFHDAHMQKSARAIVLSGSGSAFCAGMDLAEMSAANDQPNSFDLWEQDARAYRELVETMLRFPKPIVAAINGPAMAGGAGLLLASDIVVAAHTATIGLPEPRRGIVAGLVAPLLHFRVGGSTAAYLLMTAKTITAAEAHRVGIFHEIVDHDQVWVRANDVAADCAACAPEALLMTKRMLNETIGHDMLTMLAAGAAVSSTARTTEAATEGLKAFLESRKPEWS